MARDLWVMHGTVPVSRVDARWSGGFEPCSFATVHFVSDASLRFERPDDHPHVAVLTLDRPEARNALTFGMYADLERAVRTLAAGDVRCLVITGADPAFCSGDDVRQVMGGGEEGGAPIDRQERTPRLTPAADALLHTDVPVIAAVNGAAVGWGMELAMMADLRVASERAKFGELFVLRGLVSDVAGLGRLAQLVGRERAAELLFTGDVIDAAEALRIGLVSRVVPHDDLLPAALALADRIAANPPLAVQALKRGLRQALDPDWAELGAWVSSTLGELFATDDHREGVRAFLERRPARFTGR
jgi:enoyl-CoA hydratase/carnithine racemase